MQSLLWGGLGGTPRKMHRQQRACALPRETPRKGERPPESGLSPKTLLGVYLTSTVAPASSSCALIESASSCGTPSLTSFGAESTRSFASFRPRPVIARTTLITWIFWPPAAVRTTSNADFSSTAAPSPAAPAAPGAATATGAAAVMPHSSSIFFFSSTSSSTFILPSSSNTLSVALAAISAPPVQSRLQFRFQLTLLVALSHLSPRRPRAPLRQRTPRRAGHFVALSHLPPLPTCRPAPRAARCGRRSGRTGPAVAP